MSTTTALNFPILQDYLNNGNVEVRNVQGQERIYHMADHSYGEGSEFGLRLSYMFREQLLLHLLYTYFNGSPE